MSAESNSLRWVTVFLSNCPPLFRQRLPSPVRWQREGFKCAPHSHSRIAEQHVAMRLSRSTNYIYKIEMHPAIWSVHVAF